MHDGAKRQRRKRKKMRNHEKLIPVIKAQLMVAATVMKIGLKTQIILEELEHMKNILAEN